MPYLFVTSSQLFTYFPFTESFLCSDEDNKNTGQYDDDEEDNAAAPEEEQSSEDEKPASKPMCAFCL